MAQSCFCQSGKSFQDCCEPFINGEKTPNTARELMRSRYSAFNVENAEYLFETTHPAERSKTSKASILSWAKSVQWKGLEIQSTTLGGINHTNGQVEFKAIYIDKDGVQKIQHEDSSFIKENGKWYYTTGVFPKKESNEVKKTGRNDPCPCGSGKKFKKCCG